MNQPLPMRLLGIVLCGGRSKRMGCDKASLQHPAGGTYLTHAVHRLEPLCEQVCLSGQNAAHSSLVTIPDAIASAGPAAGVAAALQFACVNEFDAVLVTPVDMPSLTTDDLQVLQNEWQRDHHQFVVAQSDTDERLQPLVAIYPIRLSLSITTFAQGDDRSLNRWIAANSHVAVPLSQQSCHNVNTPEDLVKRGR
ncbi:MAG: molybdenum cofactor guanylyltransferase [Planctomycetota bacterium]